MIKFFQIPDFPQNKVVLIVLLLLCSGLNNNCTNDSNNQTKPNFIFIYADNLGYGDIGCFGSTIHRTPNIDKMADEGIKLTSLYSSSPVCTPSRASFITGCYAQRVDMHLNENNGRVLFPVSPKGLNPSEVTIAEILKNQGYKTACIGKWHLGDQQEFLPLNHGFDYFFGLPYSEDMTPQLQGETRPELPLIQNNKVIEAPADLTTTTARYVREAINFIKENKNNPFFLYFPHNLPGSRSMVVVDERFRGKSKNLSWGDSVEEVDWSVGEIIKALKELGLERNTMVVFTSDNGAPPYRRNRSGVGSNEPFRGPGYSTFEAGMRMPVVVKWPGVITAGIVSNELCTMMDWLPTFAFLAEAQIPQDRIIDGKNIWPVISGEENAKSPHELFFYYHMDQLQAVRDGRWKLHLPLEQKLVGGNNFSNYEQSGQMLIDLNVDYKETRDLSNEHPEVVERLLKHAENMKEELGDLNKKGAQIRPAGYVENPKPLLQ